jgi:hypothetical protein
MPSNYEAFTKTADMFEHDHATWGQGTYKPYREGGQCFCIIGGLRHVVDPNSRNPLCEVEDRFGPPLAIALGAALNFYPVTRPVAACCEVIKWNDASERTVEEVIAPLRKAAAA